MKKQLKRLRDTDSHRFYMENGFDATHIDLTMDL